MDSDSAAIGDRFPREYVSNASNPPPKRWVQKPCNDNERQRCDDRLREKKGRPIIEDFMRRRAKEVGADIPVLKIPTALVETAVQSVNFVIPSPTQGIGFIVNELFVRFGQMPANECTVFQLFRFILAQLELQLMYACEKPANCYPFADYHFRFDTEMIAILKGASENFSVLVAMIEYQR